ncbi:MAG: PDZ domain-containing protein [Clostridiales bacterium]|nr:PDZ domain-containing protein [Clostridiales bacterium]
MSRKIKATLLGVCMLLAVTPGSVMAESVEIIGEDTIAAGIGEETEVSSLVMQMESIEAYESTEEDYVELYANLLVRNMDYEDYAVKEDLTASMQYMSRYEFEMDIEGFAFPTDPSQTVTDYVLDPLCEMIVLLHAQVPSTIAEMEGELLLTVECSKGTAQFSLSSADIGEVKTGTRVSKIRTELVSEEERGYIGISYNEMTSDQVETYDMPEGLYIAEVVEDSPAYNAGVIAGYILTEFDGISISTTAELQDLIQYYAAGETVSVVVSYQSQGEYVEETLSITLGLRSDYQ